MEGEAGASCVFVPISRDTAGRMIVSALFPPGFVVPSEQNLIFCVSGMRWKEDRLTYPDINSSRLDAGA